MIIVIPTIVVIVAAWEEIVLLFFFISPSFHHIAELYNRVWAVTPKVMVERLHGDVVVEVVDDCQCYID